MTLSPVEIARKVLEAGEAATTRPWTSDARYVSGGIDNHNIADVGYRNGEADRAFIVAACNGAEALARAVIELSAENERHEAVLRDVADNQCDRWPESENHMSDCRRCAALAALSPTEGDGRKDSE